MDIRKDTRNAIRTEAHQQRLDKLREVREKLPVADKCGSCGTTESPGFTRCVELGMVLCNREYSYWQRNGELSPTNTGIGEERETIKAMFPTLDKCGSCGTTEGSFNRCKEAGMVLCKREYKYWQVHGRLKPSNTQAEEREAMKAMFPTLDKCGSCGTTEGPFNRCKGVGMVLCRREYGNFRNNGRLKSPRRKG